MDFLSFTLKHNRLTAVNIFRGRLSKTDQCLQDKLFPLLPSIIPVPAPFVDQERKYFLPFLRVSS